MAPETILKQYYGYDSFRYGQKECVDSLLQGRDVLAIMPTGAGKSVCYQIPAIAKEGVAIVISPLISLMKDQVSSLIHNGIPAAYVNSTLTAAQLSLVMERIAEGRYKIIYAAPERLLTAGWLNAISTQTISLVAVDEAHCISQWGHQFRPDYRRIPEFLSRLKQRPAVGAFTATATAEVRNDIRRQLNLNHPFEITTSFDRPNLFFDVRRVQNRDAAVLQYVKRHSDRSGIVYCGTRNNVDELTQYLNQKGIKAVRYHAGVSEQERQMNQDDFLFDRSRVMVATNAFGMGIDKSNVSFVIHYNMPKDIEAYYQEAGRAGRDGSPAECILFSDKKDISLNRFLIQKSNENSDLEPEVKKQLLGQEIKRLEKMTGYAAGNGCYRHYILKYFGEASRDHCANCGYCRKKYKETDITVNAQKILSCIYRTEQKLSKDMLYAILAGTAEDPRYNRLTTCGIMRNCGESLFDQYIDALSEQQLICEAESSLKLLPAAADVLKGNRTCSMIVLNDEEQKKKDMQEKLFNKLRRVRSTLAQEEGVPAYQIFTDHVLRQMCEQKPKTVKKLRQIQGIGKVKAKKYGKYFLAVLKDVK